MLLSREHKSRHSAKDALCRSQTVTALLRHNIWTKTVEWLMAGHMCMSATKRPCHRYIRQRFLNLYSVSNAREAAEVARPCEEPCIP